MSEKTKDEDNAEAWAELIRHVLYRVPIENRLDVLTIAINGESHPGHRNAVMRLKSLIIQVFVRDITNNHSTEDADRLLFEPKRYGTGSGQLLDYLAGLPSLQGKRPCH